MAFSTNGHKGSDRYKPVNKLVFRIIKRRGFQQRIDKSLI